MKFTPGIAFSVAEIPHIVARGIKKQGGNKMSLVDRELDEFDRAYNAKMKEIDDACKAYDDEAERVLSQF